jgi:ADP-ribose pyrophosphatase YjhB (NUDIX family)
MGCKNTPNGPVFKVEARAILLDEKKRVLLGKRTGGMEAGKWSLVGGKPEEEESAEEAVKREVKDEIGLKFKPIFYQKAKGFDKKSGIKWRSTRFFGDIKSTQEFDYDKSEFSEIKFFSSGELDNLEIAFNHKEILKNFFKNIKQAKKKRRKTGLIKPK